MTRSRDLIVQEIAHEESRVAELARALDEIWAKIALLHSELHAVSAQTPLSRRISSGPDGKSLLTSTDKVKLFRSLFRGRPDVFPLRFVSKKTGKPGYAPACSNKWEPRLCLLKTGGKCGDCTNQAFVAVGDQVVIDHLRGRHTIGTYPILEGDTCWFLAADFDKSSWKEDVGAFVETCRIVGTPVAIERSRSGNGAHAWFFFTAPVAASVARQMGCYLITETMNRRHELSMESYDRLFPNQDTMPRGGFGNLIALPLQHEPRQQGNSLFVDDQFKPLTDQWEFLASVHRIEPSAVEAIARDAIRSEQVVGVRFAEIVDDQESAAPWKRPPSRQAAFVRITSPLPKEVNAVLAQRFFIAKAGLPSALRIQRADRLFLAPC